MKLMGVSSRLSPCRANIALSILFALVLAAGLSGCKREPQAGAPDATPAEGAEAPEGDSAASVKKHVAEQDKWAAEALASKDKDFAEAREWLKSDLHGGFESNKKDVSAVVEEMYAKGAEKVYMVYISTMKPSDFGQSDEEWLAARKAAQAEEREAAEADNAPGGFRRRARRLQSTEALETAAPKIESTEPEEIGLSLSDSVVVVLPADPAKRKALIEAAYKLNSEGEEGDLETREDIGQKYLVFMWD